VEHLPRQAAGLGILAAWVIGVDERGNAGVDRAVDEGERALVAGAAEAAACLVGVTAEREEHARLGEQGKLPGEEGPAGGKLRGGGSVGGRDTPKGVGDIDAR
jgi:hypothetical protein